MLGSPKTIEAGLITHELLLRRKVQDIVVACPPSMISQWKDELEQPASTPSLKRRGSSDSLYSLL